MRECQSINNENRHLLYNPSGHHPYSLLFIVCWMKIAHSPGKAQIGILLVLVQCLELTVTVECSSHTPSLLWVENSHKHAEKGLQECGGSCRNHQEREAWGMPDVGKIMPSSSSLNETLTTLWNMPRLHLWHSFGAWKRRYPEQELSVWNCINNWT